MLRIPSSHLCPTCGTPEKEHQRFCPTCGRETHSTHEGSEGQAFSQNSDATIQVASRRSLLSSHLEDDDATLLAAPRLSAQVLQQITRMETEQPEEEKSITEESPLQERPSPTRWFQSRGKTGSTLLTNPRTLLLSSLAICLVLVFVLANLAGFGVDRAARQEAMQNKKQLDLSLQHASSLGVPHALLQPIQTEEQHINNMQATFAFFSASSNYYHNQAKLYHNLTLRIPGIITSATQQAQLQAQIDMQNFQTALSQSHLQNSGNIQYFSQQYSQDQLSLSSAQYPKDFYTISTNARQAIQVVREIHSTSGLLTDFQQTISRMQQAHLDTTAMQSQYQDDMQVFNNATDISDLQNLDTQINAQYQQAVVNAIQAFPYISLTKLNELENQIHQLQTYGMDADYYQSRLNADRVAVEQAKTTTDDIALFQQIDGDISSMHDELVRGDASYLVKQFTDEVNTWGKAHAYHDSYDGHDYMLDSGYTQYGIGSTLQNDLTGASSSADFEAVVVEASSDLFNLHMLEADYSDHTPYNAIHATDTQMLNYYQLQGKQVLMVSLVEQAMRVYQQGKLVQSFHTTTGRQERPSLPGVWAVLDRKSPIIFKSGDPQGSPYWFPDTPIQYAILYHWGGDFVHDAPWRATFGPGTQFPHQDASGTTAYNFDGSHGCINLSENDAAWVYHHTDWNTVIVVY